MTDTERIPEFELKSNKVEHNGCCLFVLTCLDHQTGKEGFDRIIVPTDHPKGYTVAAIDYLMNEIGLGNMLAMRLVNEACVARGVGIESQRAKEEKDADDLKDSSLFGGPS